jgi:hypothetical protein
MENLEAHIPLFELNEIDHAVLLMMTDDNLRDVNAMFLFLKKKN